MSDQRPPMRPQSTSDRNAMNAMMAERIARQMPLQPYTEGTYALRVAEIVGRTSGRVIAVPIGVVQVGGVRYLISPTRERPWARNLLAAGECTLVGNGSRERARAVLAPDDEAVPVLRTYTALLSDTMNQFPFPRGADDAQIRAAAHQTAVFRLAPLPDPAAPAAPEREDAP